MRVGEQHHNGMMNDESCLVLVDAAYGESHLIMANVGEALFIMMMIHG